MVLSTIVVSEQPTNREGEVNPDAKPGWYALKDDPALTGKCIHDVADIAKLAKPDPNRDGWMPRRGGRRFKTPIRPARPSPWTL